MFDITFTARDWYYQEYQDDCFRFTLWGARKWSVAGTEWLLFKLELRIETYNTEYRWWQYV